MRRRGGRGLGWRVLGAAIVTLCAGAVEARAQSSSMFGQPAQRPPLTLNQFSWTYQAVEEPPVIKIHDLVTVIVDEASQVTSEGEMDRRKKAHGKWALTDWISLHNYMLRPDKQGGGDPTIAGEMDTKYQAEAELETRDAMKFRIACHVVDIRPNGSLVLEGHRSIRNNQEVWEMSLSGVVRPEDIMPDNTVESENIAELRIDKGEAGHVRDGYNRGWMQTLLDEYQPF